MKILNNSEEINWKSYYKILENSTFKFINNEEKKQHKKIKKNNNNNNNEKILFKITTTNKITEGKIFSTLENTTFEQYIIQ